MAIVWDFVYIHRTEIVLRCQSLRIKPQYHNLTTRPQTHYLTNGYYQGRACSSDLPFHGRNSASMRRATLILRGYVLYASF